MKNCYLGIDIGSISTKGVIIDENNNIIRSLYIWTEGNPIKATEKLIKKYQQRGFEVCKYQYPEQYKDINDYLKLGFQGRKIPLTRGRL